MKKTKSDYQYIRKTWTDDDGVRHEVCGRTEEEAIRKMIARQQEIAEGRVDSAATVADWARAWTQTYLAQRRITDKSKAMYKRYLSGVIVPALGGVRLRKVTPLRLQQLLNSRAGKSRSDAEKLRLVLRALFGEAYRNRLIPFDPSAGLQLPATSVGGHRSLRPEERRALIAVAERPDFDGKPNRSGCWLLLMLRCGLRPGETAALRKADVDLPARVIRVRSAKESGSSRIKDPKTAAGVRSVPIPEDLVPWLERQLAETSAPWVFTQKDKKSPLSETAMRRRWETVKKYMDLELGAKAEKIKVPGARRRSLVITQHALAEDLDLYDLRHTYCTDLEAAGVPINVAKTLMGHRDIATTANIYTHASEVSLEAARRLLNAAAGAPEPKPAVENPVEKEKPDS